MTDQKFTILDQTGADVYALKTLQQKYALQFEREKTALKYYMLGKGYTLGIKALGFIERIEFRIPAEERFRKDKATPSLHHQVRIALSVTQLKGLTNEQEELCIVLALLHDVQEDHGVPHDILEGEFGIVVADKAWKLTKKFAGQHKNKDAYIHDISQDIVTAIVKGLDRCDNLSTMVDVFSTDKIDQYSTEAEKVFLPMTKTAMKLYPELYHAFQAISLRMKREIKMARQLLVVARASEAGAARAANNEALLIDENTRVIKAMVEATQERDVLKSSIERDKANILNDKKAIFAAITRSLTSDRIATKLDTADIAHVLADVSIALGISTLELATFKPDQFSDGTTVVNVDRYGRKDF